MIGYITLGLAAVYAAYLIRLAKSVPKQADTVPDQITSEKISVIVPFRNEEMVLGELLACIDKQDYSGQWEVILVDDHSSDNSSRIAVQFAQEKQYVRYLQAKGKGKKQSLREAIDLASGTIIITLDADVRIGPDWLSTAGAYWKFKNPEMMVMPVFLDRAKDFQGRIEQLEFASVSAVTAGAIGSGKPLMCNGANLAFRKSAFDAMLKSDRRDDLASGDDMFLLISIARKNSGQVHYLNHPKAIASTAVLGNPGEFLRQRVRWASKIDSMKYGPITLAGAIIGGFHLSLIIAIFFEANLILWVLAWGLKAIADLVILNRITGLFRISIRPEVFIALELIHPFYSILIPLVGIVWKPSWKGRKITSNAV